jgi:hypothetical protein
MTPTKELLRYKTLKEDDMSTDRVQVKVRTPGLVASSKVTKALWIGFFLGTVWGASVVVTIAMWWPA